MQMRMCFSCEGGRKAKKAPDEISPRLAAATFFFRTGKQNTSSSSQVWLRNSPVAIMVSVFKSQKKKGRIVEGYASFSRKTTNIWQEMRYAAGDDNITQRTAEVCRTEGIPMICQRLV